MSLPSGWIANFPAPEESMPEYTGDPTSLYAAVPGSQMSMQPKTAGNPAGQIPGMLTIGMTPLMWARLSGPQPG